MQNKSEYFNAEIISRMVEEQNRLVAQWIEADRKKTEASKRWFELHQQIKILKAIHE